MFCPPREAKKGISSWTILKIQKLLGKNGKKILMHELAILIESYCWILHHTAQELHFILNNSFKGSIHFCVTYN